jgi:hypothetical protein
MMGRRVLAALTILLALAGVAPAQNKARAVIWRDPGRVERLDLVRGAGGREGAPRPPLRFVEEDEGGSNPKVKVRDARGVEWSVKWGNEVSAEVFASRIAWAAGYYVEPAYFVRRGKILGVKNLGRAKDQIAPDGSFVNARFEPRPAGVERLGDEESWRWDENPFKGTRELNGLKIVVMLVSNWDSKDARDSGRGSNTGIHVYETRRGLVARYLITDWGGSMGKWGNYFTREKWDCEEYTKQTPDFIKGVENGKVKWGYTGQHTDSIRDDIPVEHVKWLLNYLGRLTDRQIRSALKSSGATPEETECFAKAFRARIEQMKELR